MSGVLSLAQGLLSAGRRRRRFVPERFRRGFSLPELLVVLAIVGLSVAVAVPLVSHELHMVRMRTAADQFASDLRAARMIAVSTRGRVGDRGEPVSVQVFVEPENFYTYPDARGQPRRVEMPQGVHIVSSPSSIVFGMNGSIAAEAVTIFEAGTSDGTDRWTVTTSRLGIPRTTREHVP